MSSNDFQPPDVDDPASTEIGVILLGLDADRLLAGLGLASLADDPAQVTLVVDQARHGTLRALDLDVLVALGADRWRRVRVALTGANLGSAALRQLWVRAGQAVDEAAVGELGPASRAYLTACLLRRVEVDRHLETNRDVSEVPG